MHTACGRSESKHLRPTPAGHVEGCPVIALCRPGSPWQAGRGPVSCESGPGGLATQHRAGAARAQGRPLPSPGRSSLLSGPEEPGPPVSGAVCPGTWAARPPWPPALQLGVGGVGWGGSGGSLRATRPWTGSQVGGGVRRRLQRRFSRRGKQQKAQPHVDGTPLKTQPVPRQTAKGPACPEPR